MSYLEIINKEFLIIFFTILFSNIIILKYRYKIAKHFNIIDIPNERKIHETPTPLIGGIIYFFSLLIILFYILFNDEIDIRKFISLIFIYSIFFFVGFFDDIKTLSAKLRSILIIGSLIFLIFFDRDFLISNLNFKSFNSVYNLNNFSFFFTLF